MSRQKVEMIAIDVIKVVNERSRNKVVHDEITETIHSSGLRRPVTVRKIKDENYQYALICGQGRLESLSLLGEKFVPAIVKDVSSEDAYVMSLVENIARRKPRANELYERIREMYLSGVSEEAISEYVGCSVHWVQSVLLLLNRGEQKLLSIVESGDIPIYMAVEFARCSGEENQDILIEAYDKGIVKHHNVTKIREILEMRSAGLKGNANLAYTKRQTSKKITPEQLLDIYQKSVEEHKNILRKYETVVESITLCKRIMSNLLKNPDFIRVLSEEGLNSVPDAILDKHDREETENDSALLQ
ncbi:ParB/RepB/Spo0J family partition protein [Pantoea sp. EA-12]|uniref:ParB/RepB/Spo0J family partition protein n=1 Tax=Pantoea sp. EA-12 TaxID=3043303 RepID=UPI0024B591C6|nr:ParB/RepB/Spo0J family partition protein [Pantoea sp. EA-12]MDI9222120.1 ParB/RepB/Spo0J family partition protein [Pantoea sp. EA-12]